MHSYRLTGPQVEEIFNVRLRPYLPSYLVKLEPHTYHVRYTFTPFTGHEAEPETPARCLEDPNLAYRHTDKEAGRPVADDAEYELRSAARDLLDDVYRAARAQWRNARHVAELKATVKNAGDLLKTHHQARRAVEAAFAYLREPQAATEWPAVLSRLIDAQDAYLAAAVAFDERAREIAKVHDRNTHEEMLSYAEALTAAGYPEGGSWPIVSAEDYDNHTWGSYGSATTAGQAQALIKEQEAHVARIARLSGTGAG
ncbi:hypothetical protein AB0N88_16125 [Streptomyces sp. NPDC093516]|uniref:hypothetical protein n=1 Tax=Streptomyces sp. NPDC093516 TaxID=3155304 RepID=UPI00342082A6